MCENADSQDMPESAPRDTTPIEAGTVMIVPVVVLLNIVEAMLEAEAKRLARLSWTRVSEN